MTTARNRPIVLLYGPEATGKDLMAPFIQDVFDLDGKLEAGNE